MSRTSPHSEGWSSWVSQTVTESCACRWPAGFMLTDRVALTGQPAANGGAVTSGRTGPRAQRACDRHDRTRASQAPDRESSCTLHPWCSMTGSLPARHVGSGSFADSEALAECGAACGRAVCRLLLPEGGSTDGHRPVRVVRVGSLPRDITIPEGVCHGVVLAVPGTGRYSVPPSVWICGCDRWSVHPARHLHVRHGRNSGPNTRRVRWIGEGG
jgi:hypothetical protein